MTTTLLDQAAEVLHIIFQYVDATDLASLSRSCKAFSDFIANDELLWKTVYLRRFDPPSSQHGGDGTRWDVRLKRITHTQKILESRNMQVKHKYLEQVLGDCIDLMTLPAPDCELNTKFLTSHFADNRNVSAFLCRSSLFDWARYEDEHPAETEQLRQLSAKLHVFSGLDLEPTSDDLEMMAAAKVHPFARSRVYDLRRYHISNLWGPFKSDGITPDWEKLQSIMIDLAYNLRLYLRRPRRITISSPSSVDSLKIWNKPFEGIGVNSFRSSPLQDELLPPDDPSLNFQDPYNVTGTWMRIVCFLDYNDLHSFNFETPSPPPGQDRPPIYTREAFRLIKLTLTVTLIEPGTSDPSGATHPDHPIVHFTGTSHSTHLTWDPNANSQIRGTVRTTPTGAIRWTSFSILHGEERWRSESVQLGSANSARGILGNWFDKDYDIHGPAGPTAFWKLSDDIVDEEKRRQTLQQQQQQQQSQQHGPPPAVVWGVNGLEGIGIAAGIGGGLGAAGGGGGGGAGATEAWQQIIEMIFDQ